MQKKISAAIILSLVLSMHVFSEDAGTRISPEAHIKELLDDSDKSDEQRRMDYIEAAEIKQLTGDIGEAAELFKKASLTVKGQKDFVSLYRAAVLNIEMASYRAAEADLRAILTFSDDYRLRVLANVQNARIDRLNGRFENAKAIMTEIFESSDYIPAEAIYFSGILFSQEDFYNLTSGLDITAEDYLSYSPMLTPENVFGTFKDYEDAATETQTTVNTVNTVEIDNSTAATQTEDSTQTYAAGIQLGSFSVKENAEDLKKTLKNVEYESIIKMKNVNGKDYYTVVVPVENVSSIQQLIIELKEKGFEGYPVY